MAPSNVFSYLRSHKRSGSNPTSPLPPNSSNPFILPHQPTESYLTPHYTPTEQHATYLSPVLPSLGSPVPPTPPPKPYASPRPDISRSHTEGTRALSSTDLDQVNGNVYASRTSSRDDSHETGKRPAGVTVQMAREGRRPSAASIGLGQFEVPQQSTSSLPLPSPSQAYQSQAYPSPTFLPERGSGKDRPPLTTSTSSYTLTQKSGKTKLNKLNPMSLLTRRRTGQTLELVDDSLVTRRNLSVPAMSLPDGYDPRIRGSVIHDFSKPRQRKDFSLGPRSPGFVGAGTSASTLEQAPEVSRRLEQERHLEREHTPVFKENFDDEDNAGVRAEALANKDFLSRVAAADVEHEPSSSPPFGRSSFSAPSLTLQKAEPTAQNKELPPLPTVIEVTPVSSPTANTVPAEASPTTSKASPKNSPKEPPSPAGSSRNPSFKPKGLPKHLSSNASRFSFQIGGVASAEQEKMLEEKHREKMAAKKTSLAVSGAYDADVADDEDAMYEDMMNDGYEEEIPGAGDDFEEDLYFSGAAMQNNMGTLEGYEKQIPGVNADMQDDEDGFDETQAPDMSGFSIPSHTSAVVASNSTGPQALAIGMPISGERNFTSQAIEQGSTSDQSSLLASDVSLIPVQNEPAQLATSMSGLGLTGLATNFSHTSPTVQESYFVNPVSPSQPHPASKLQQNTEDDFYFDDGLIEAPPEEVGEGFDESVFDDPNHPLYERVAPARPKSLGQLPGEAVSGEGGQQPQREHDLDKHSSTNPSQPQASKDSVRHDSAMPHFTSGVDVDLLSQNLNAYHSALAEAANKAAADGRFNRKDSTASMALSSQDGEANAVLSSKVPLTESNLTTMQKYSFPDESHSTFPADDYDFDPEYDSALEDDPMIAEANAEALASDDEGFYGREFGFYANSNGNEPAYNGGYWGPSGAAALGRSVSGRNAVREPNLTPITERSEYSTRNSFISLNQFSTANGMNGGQPLPSPGLAQLARMGSFGMDDDDLTMSHLEKLRKKAFGGSNGSISSGAASPMNSSPIGNHGYSSYSTQYAAHGSSPMAIPGSRMGWHSLEEDDELDDELDDDLPVDEVNGYASSDDENHPKTNGNGITEQPFDSSEQSKDPSPLSASPTIRARNTVSFSDDDTPHLSLQTITNAISSEDPIKQPPLPTKNDISTAATNTAAAQSHRKSYQSHSRSGSGADSVTYVREQDGAGGNRWVLERRRTAETGELELIAREIIEGGRI